MKLINFLPDLDLEMAILEDDKATVASVVVSLFDENGRRLYEKKVSGSAIRFKEDKCNSDVGASLALGRALVNAGRGLERFGDGLVKHIDDMKIQKKAQKERMLKENPRGPGRLG